MASDAKTADTHDADVGQESMSSASGQLSGLSTEDQKVVVSLCQTCPQLWQDFSNIVDLCDDIDQNITGYQGLLGKFLKILKLFTRQDIVHVCRFVVAVGFVEQMVKLYRNINAELGAGFVCSTNPANKDHKLLCLSCTWALFHNFSHFGNEFRLRLAHTGFLKDKEEGLKHMTHVAPEALESQIIIWWWWWRWRWWWWWWWLFSRLRGFGDNERPFIPRLRIFFRSGN